MKIFTQASCFILASLFLTISFAESASNPPVNLYLAPSHYLPLSSASRVQSIHHLKNNTYDVRLNSPAGPIEYICQFFPQSAVGDWVNGEIVLISSNDFVGKNNTVGPDLSCYPVKYPASQNK